MPEFDINYILISIPGILIGFSFHEFAHAFVADRLGDPTPRSLGRLTLSPLPHIDIMGFFMILLFHFGWAKPVQINTKYFKKPRRDEILVSIAGPIMNLILAIVFTILLKLLFIYAGSASFNDKQSLIVEILYRIIDYTIFINLILFIFNLIPLPPLDGFHVLANFIPARWYKVVQFLWNYSTIILIIIILTPAVSFILGPMVNFLISILTTVFNVPI